MSTVPLPVAVGVGAAVFVRPFWLGIVLGVALAAGLTSNSLRRVRRRFLTVAPAGLEVQRDGYALRVRWDQVVGVQRRRHQGLIPVEELVLASAEVVPRTSTGKVKAPPASLQRHPASTRIMVSLYDAAWREGPIGDHLQGLAGVR
ncbi:hypothetical protein [Cellulomonas sp. NTE-D12]|uniref:hypothetical protein n=1 Tax=Cellulomonas sp. NTE-D12 TaxID=2962632 RepID=UPI00308215C8|nr:hypothetical protein CELD12_30550 [Cellulomonas sp. NTE-D12]